MGSARARRVQPRARVVSSVADLRKAGYLAEWDDDPSRNEALDDGLLKTLQVRIELYGIRRDLVIMAHPGVVDALDVVIDVIDEIGDSFSCREVPSRRPL